MVARLSLRVSEGGFGRKRVRGGFGIDARRVIRLMERIFTSNVLASVD